MVASSSTEWTQHAVFRPIQIDLHIGCDQLRIVPGKRPLALVAQEATNGAEVWQRGYDSVRFLARYNVLESDRAGKLAGLDEALAKQRYSSIRYRLAAKFASLVSTCGGIVGPFKHLLRVTAHPQFFAGRGISCRYRRTR